jgi:hypothetical protein
VSVAPEIALAFKAVCAASNVSMAAEISRFMADYANSSVKQKVAPNYSTRRHRRTAVKAMIKELVLIRACEEKVRDNTPENLQGSSAYDATEEVISALDEAIDALTEL